MLISCLFQNLREHVIASNTLNFAEELTPYDLVRSLRHLEFDEAGQQIKTLLEKGYRDGIDGLEEVRVEGDKIKGIFTDKVTSTLTKRYEFTIDENAIKYKLLNPSAVEQADFTELEFARTKLAGDTKKVKTCPKGTPCRFSCIAKGKECSYTPSADEKGEITFLKQKIGGKKTKTIADIDNKSAVKYDDKKADTTSTAADKKSSKNMNSLTIPSVPETEIPRLDRSSRLVAVKKIQIGEKDYDQSEIDNLAQSILQNRTQFPVVVKRSGANFEVVSGEKVAVAMKRAREIDLKSGENANVYIANDDDEAKALAYQTQFLNEPSAKLPPPSAEKRILDKVNVDQLGQSQLVNVRRIEGGTKEFDQEVVENLANSQLKVGNIMPIVIQRQGIGSFKLISGDLALAAARRAKEIDPRSAEQTRVFIAENDAEAEALKYQVGTEKKR